MRIVAISDLHLDHVTAGVSRFDEIRVAVEQSVDAAIERKADFYICLGDIFDPDAGSCVFRCLDVLVGACVRLHSYGIQVIALAGNHDTIEDGRGDTTISPLRSLPGVRVVEEPTSWRVHYDQQDDVQFLCLPYTSTSRSYDPADVVRRECVGDGRLVVFGHLNVRGVVPGSEITEMPRGRDVWLPDEELAAVARRRATFVISGHIHRAQEHICPSGLPVRIVGSPSRLTHGEEENQPSFLVVDL